MSTDPQPPELTPPFTYQHGPGGIFMTRHGGKTQPVATQLTRWTARIVAETSIRGGRADERQYKIEVTAAGLTATVTVPASRLRDVPTWSGDAIGTAAVIYPNQRVHDHIVAAIQDASPHPRRLVVYSHTGWTTIDGDTVYLHAGGCIGARGSAGTTVQVQLPSSLALTCPLQPTSADAERRAVRATLTLLDVAPDHVTVPVLAAAWRAPLTDSHLTVWVTGSTGAGKTALTALAQSHFGAGFTAHTLPAAWSGTANSINEVAHIAKDMLLVVDDFVPKGTADAGAQLHRTAEDVVRAQGNSAGRSRLDSASTLLDARPPRATLLASGEETPDGASTRARMLIVDLRRGDLNFTKLTPAQELGRSGVLATAMGGYIRWLAHHPDRRSTADALTGLRDRFSSAGRAHARTPDVLAEAALGWNTMLDYATSCGAITTNEATALRSRVSKALLTVGIAQADQQTDSDPATRFLQLVRAALSSGRAHVSTPAGAPPEDPDRWGWRQQAAGSFPGDWQARGPRIGWTDDEYVYLDPDPAIAAADSLRNGGSDLRLTTTTLGKRLNEARFLVTTPSRGTLTVRKSVGSPTSTIKSRPETWKILASRLNK